MQDSVTHRKGMLKGLLSIPGYIEDVARSAISLAKLSGPDSTVEIVFGGKYLHVRSDHEIQDVRRQFETIVVERSRNIFQAATC